MNHEQVGEDEDKEVEGGEEEKDARFVSSRGVHFTSLEGRGAPHGLSCVKEVLRFLVSITDPRDAGNSSRLIGIGLGLVTVALEVGCRELGRFPSLLGIVSNRLCRHLMMVSVCERVSVCLLVSLYD